MFRMLRTGAACAALMLAASATAQQAGPPAALIAAITATEAAKAAYAFDLEIESSERAWRARFDPGATPRLRLVQPAQLEGDEQRAFERMAEQMEGVSWCASESIGRVENLRLLREDATSATYAFQPTRESVRGAQARRFAERMLGELTLTKSDPDISRVRVYTPAAFSPMPLVRVERVDITINCQAAPNGRRYAAETISEARGSAFGEAFEERSVQRARNLSEAP